MTAPRQNTTRFLSLATGLLALGGTIHALAVPAVRPEREPSAIAVAEDVGVLTPIERLQELLDMMCAIVPCAGAAPTEVTVEEVEQLAVIRMTSYRLAGIYPGLSQDELYKGIGIVDQTEKWLQTNPGLLSSVIESDLASTLAEMRADLEEGLE